MSGISKSPRIGYIESDRGSVYVVDEMPDLEQHAAAHLSQLTGVASAGFRSGQFEAIRSIVEDRGRVLVVQRTGWGKSAVYLIATKLIREGGGGPTVIVSPLLALMRNQLEMTERLGLRAHTVNSTNPEEWDGIFSQIRDGTLDLLLISPERLNNDVFLRDVRPQLFGRVGLLVIDEVHCISDWGHDFRPDYRRLREIALALPPGTPVLGTTATANDRVVADVREQLGDDLAVYRGTLERESLVLGVLPIPDKAKRMAWLAQHIPTLAGSGIVYCLTVHDAERVGSWLISRGIDAATYTGPTPHDERLRIEEDLSAGNLKVVVATSALAMGYDNPKIEFVIHYQSPGSPISYYQQVGRAGRAVERSHGVLMTGWEDADVQDWFISTAFPPEGDTRAVLAHLRDEPGSRLGDLEQVVNLRRSRLSGMLKILEVERAVYREASRWFRSAQAWNYPDERIRAVTEQRRTEQEAMAGYATTDRCLMEYLRRQLDDPGAERCGRCANCAGPSLPVDIDPELVEEALRAIRSGSLVIEPRRRLPCPCDEEIDLKAGGLEPGRSLSRWGDPGLAELVARGKHQEGRFGDRLVAATVAMIDDWAPDPCPTWVAWVPSRQGGLVEDFARRLAAQLGANAVAAVLRSADVPPQREMHNSCQQFRNVAGAFEIVSTEPGPVFLVDDMVDSRWTFTVLGARLRMAGSGPVYPVALADTLNRGE